MLSKATAALDHQVLIRTMRNVSCVQIAFLPVTTAANSLLFWREGYAANTSTLKLSHLCLPLVRSLWTRTEALDRLGLATSADAWSPPQSCKPINSRSKRPPVLCRHADTQEESRRPSTQWIILKKQLTARLSCWLTPESRNCASKHGIHPTSTSTILPKHVSSQDSGLCWQRYRWLCGGKHKGRCSCHVLLRHRLDPSRVLAGKQGKTRLQRQWLCWSKLTERLDWRNSLLQHGSDFGFYSNASKSYRIVKPELCRNQCSNHHVRAQMSGRVYRTRLKQIRIH